MDIRLELKYVKYKMVLFKYEDSNPKLLRRNDLSPLMLVVLRETC